MLIHKITPSVYYNEWLKRLNIQLNKQTNQNSLKVPKVFIPTNKKKLLYNFGDSCNKQLIVTPSLLAKGHILNRSWEITFPLWTDRHTDISIFRVALLLQMNNAYVLKTI